MTAVVATSAGSTGSYAGLSRARYSSDRSRSDALRRERRQTQTPLRKSRILHRQIFPVGRISVFDRPPPEADRPESNPSPLAGELVGIPASKRPPSSAE